MPTLNLTATTNEEQKIKAYLEANASDTLAEKINDGVRIQKDGKNLLNKKTLTDFMKFACGEAQKQAEKGAQSACIDDDVVYGWAVHYFEEDSIEGTLYNEDGTEYKIQPKPAVKAPTTNYTPPKPQQPQPKPQLSMFDMLENNDNSDISAVQPQDTEEQDDEPTEEELEQVYKQIQQEPEPKTENKQQLQGSPLYRRYTEIQNKYPDFIIALRLGDFYEVLGYNAVSLANALCLTLTGRDCGLESRVPMVGFPYHMTEEYVTKAVKKGFNIALAESAEDVKTYYRTDDERQAVDLETGEILSEEEMREFDGDIDETLPTVSGLLKGYTAEPKDDKQLEQDIGAVLDDEDDFDVAAFDAGAVAILSELLGDEITLR